MKTLKQMFDHAERMLNMCLNHPNFVEGDFTNSVTRMAYSLIERLDRIERMAIDKRWDYVPITEEDYLMHGERR